MAGSVAETIRLIYELSVVDKGTKKLLDSERAVQRETKQTARAMAQGDVAAKRSATTATGVSRRRAAAMSRERAAVAAATTAVKAQTAAIDRAAAAERRLTSVQRARPKGAAGGVAPNITGAAGGAASGVSAVVSRSAKLAVGAGAGLGLKAVIGAFVGFEKQMDRVQATAGATRKEMVAMNRQAKQLGADTAFSAKEAADGMYQLSTAGFTANQTMKILPGTLDLASASGTELAAAAELQAAAIRGFGLSASDATKVADVLAKTVNSSAVEMADLGETLPYVASTARQTGTSFTEVAAAAGILGDAGIKGSMAGTALRTSMLRLTDPTKKMTGILSEMGISASDLAAKSLPEVIGRVAEGLKNLPTRGEKVGAISAIFGKEAAPSMLNLMSKGRDEIDKLVKSLENSDGAAKKTAKTMRDNVAGSWDQFTGSIETASIGLVERHGPAIQRTLDRMTKGVNDLGKELGSPKTARFASQVVSDLRPVGKAFVSVAGYLRDHPRLVVAAAAAYASFKAVRGTIKIAHDIQDISSSIAAVARRASKTKLATLLADGAKGAGSRIRRALGTVSTVVSDVMGTAASRGAEAMGAKGRWSKAGNRAGRAFGAAAVLGLAAAAPEVNKQITKLLGGSKDTPTGFGSFLFNRITGARLPGGRHGGVVGQFAGGGLVPLFAAGGEMHVDGGRASMIPGDPRSDSTLMFARPGSAIITADGQDRMAMGASLSQAIASQAPHFAKGGRVSGRFMSTSYGPPWGGIQGTGTTATGVNLRRSPHVYGVAVDPSVIPLGTQLYASPNPFGRSGPFRAFDTGGAIKGNRIDFYDWRGRKRQNAWGRKTVRVSSARLSGDTPRAPADEDVTARIPLSLSPSRVRAGLVQDAVEQGIAAGAAGLKRKEMARAVAGGRGARRNPIMEAIAGAMTPTTREVTLPGQSSDSSSGGRPDGPLPGGVTVPSAAWNPAKRPIAKWIVPYLSWAASASRGSSSSTGPARRGGGGRWSGTVTSGFRSRAEQTRIWNSGVRPAARPGNSNHEGSTYPRGAVDVTQASMLAQVLRGKPGPHLLQFAGAKDPVHFSHPHGGSYRRGGIVRRMARGGIVGGRLGTALSGAMSFKGGSFDALDAAIGGAVETRLEVLRAEVARRVKRGGDKKLGQRLQSVLDLIDFELGRRIGRYQDVVERRSAALDRAQAATDRGLRIAGIDPGSAAGVAVSARGQAAETKVRAANVASLTKALAIARRTGNQEVIRDAVDKLNEARDAAAESLVRQIELWRDQLRAIADERTANAQFRTSLSSAGGSILESWQRTAGVQDTAQSMVQRAQYTTGVTLPALEQQRQASIFAAQVAAATGDVNGWRSAVQDAASAAADIASAQADAADLIRAAANRAAQDLVDAATHGRSMADMGLERLGLEQQLIGTHDTTGGALGRADFIKASIIPAIQGEISALVVQLATAQATGDKALATQIGEAIYAKQNDVLKQQVDALNEIKSNTDPLKDFGGSTAFSYQSQTFTDLDAIRARVGA